MDNWYTQGEAEATASFYGCSVGEAAAYLANPSDYPDGPLGLVAGVAAFQMLQGFTQAAVNSGANYVAGINTRNDAYDATFAEIDYQTPARPLDLLVPVSVPVVQASFNPGTKIGTVIKDAGKGWFLTNGSTSANHPETDGKGGLLVVIATGNAYVTNNPVVRNSIILHETSHILDAYNSNNSIGNGVVAGLILSANGDTGNLSEMHAYGNQLQYLDDAITKPGKYNLNAAGTAQVQWYREWVQDKLNTGYLSLPPNPLGPRPPDEPGVNPPSP